MTYTIPFSIEDEGQECVIELLDLSQQHVIAEIYRNHCEPGTHAVDFDPSTIEGGLEAGLYIIRLTLGPHAAAYPLQYMP